MLYCPHCGTSNRDGSKFCNECGQVLAGRVRVCPACGARNPEVSLLCNGCGGPLPGGEGIHEGSLASATAAGPSLTLQQSPITVDDEELPSLEADVPEPAAVRTVPPLHTTGSGETPMDARSISPKHALTWGDPVELTAEDLVTIAWYRAVPVDEELQLGPSSQTAAPISDEESKVLPAVLSSNGKEEVVPLGGLVETSVQPEPLVGDDDRGVPPAAGLPISTAEPLPDWLEDCETGEQTTALPSFDVDHGLDPTPSPSDLSLPDWLVDAEGDLTISPLEEVLPLESGVEPVPPLAMSLPDWLVEPEGAVDLESLTDLPGQTLASPSRADIVPVERLEPLAGLPDWLEVEEPTPVREAELPEQADLAPLTTTEVPANVVELPEWLVSEEVGLSAAIQPELIPAADETASSPGIADATEIPDWLELSGEDTGPLNPLTALPPEGDLIFGETATSGDIESDSSSPSVTSLPEWLEIEEEAAMAIPPPPAEELSLETEEPPVESAALASASGGEAILPDWLGMEEEALATPGSSEIPAAEPVVPDWLVDAESEPAGIVDVIPEDLELEAPVPSETTAEPPNLPDWLADEESSEDGPGEPPAETEQIDWEGPSPVDGPAQAEAWQLLDKVFLPGANDSDAADQSEVAGIFEGMAESVPDDLFSQLIDQLEIRPATNPEETELEAPESDGSLAKEFDLETDRGVPSVDEPGTPPSEPSEPDLVEAVGLPLEVSLPEDDRAFSADSAVPDWLLATDGEAQPEIGKAEPVAATNTLPVPPLEMVSVPAGVASPALEIPFVVDVEQSRLRQAKMQSESGESSFGPLVEDHDLPTWLAAGSEAEADPTLVSELSSEAGEDLETIATGEATGETPDEEERPPAIAMAKTFQTVRGPTEPKPQTKAATEYADLFASVLTLQPEVKAHVVRQRSRVAPRLIAVLLILAVLLPFYVPFGLDLPDVGSVSAARNAVDQLPAGAPVLVSFDWNGSVNDEMRPIAHEIVSHLIARRAKIVAVSLLPEGSKLATMVIDRARQGQAYDYGTDFVVLGFHPGDETAVRLLLNNAVKDRYAVDVNGTSLKALPIFQQVTDLKDIAMVVDIAGDPEMTRWWVRQLGSSDLANETGVKMVGAVGAMGGPEMNTYLQSGQLTGLVVGVRGAAQYGGKNGEYAAILNAQSYAGIMIVICILAGNIIYLANRKQRQKK